MSDPKYPGKRPALSPARPDPRPVDVHQSLWHHCIESCVLVAVGIWLLAALLPRGIPLWEMTGPLAVLTAVTWRVAVTVTRSSAVAGWLLAWGVVLTAWFTLARISGAWSGDLIGALILAVVLLTPCGPPAIGHYRSLGTRDVAAEERAAELAELARWERMFTRMGVRGIRVAEVFRHENGLQVHGSLGKASDEHGVFTFDKLKMLAAEVATHTRTARDSVHFEQPDPDNSATFVMHLRTRKGRRTVEYLPENDHPATIGKPLELGRHDNGRPYRLLLREIAVMVCGVRGAGKSNLLNVFIAQLARCEDVLIFCIDLKGGRMARPWMQAWLEDTSGVRRPVIDWLATTRKEAYLMLETLIAAGDARARVAVGEKIRPRRELPAVILIVDETAVGTGHDRKDEEISSRKLAVLLARFAETYRSEAMDPVVAAVRGDVETMGLSAFKAMSVARFGLRVTQSGDGDSVFPDDHAAALALSKIQDDGAGLVLLKGRISNPVHFYRMTPKLAYKIARQTGPWRPAPDPHLERALGDAYANRWERMETLLDEWRATAAEFHAEAGTGGAPEPAETAGGGVATATRTRPAPAGPGGGGGDDDDQAWRGIIAHLEDPDGKVHPARQRIRELLFQAGPRGYTVGALAKVLRTEDLEVHRNTLHEWLRKDEELGRVRSKARVRNDPYARWVWIRQAGDDEILAAGQPDEDEHDEPEEDW